MIDWSAKRCLDVILVLLVMPAALPLMLISAIGIKLSSPGPVLYRARRAGKDNREFEMLKFRTMRIGDQGPLITAPDDNRIFPFGNILRATKLDEFPQLLNILKGDMSVVGPRPEDPRIVKEHYEPWMYETLEVRPGLTSPGSLYFLASFREAVDTSNPEDSYASTILAPKLKLDLDYVRNRTMLTDLQLIAKTAFLVGKKLLRNGLVE